MMGFYLLLWIGLAAVIVALAVALIRDGAREAFFRSRAGDPAGFRDRRRPRPEN